MQSDYRSILAVPSINTSMEPEMRALCPQAAPFAVARVPLPGSQLTLETLPAYSQSTLDAVAPFLKDKKPMLVVHGCTAAGLLGGPARTAEITQALAEQSGATVVSTAAAMVDVLVAEKVSSVAVLTPYLEAINDGVRRYLASADISVEVLESFECRSNSELVAVTAEQVLERALKIVSPDTQALFIACSQLPTLEVLPRLREQLGIPVWSSVSATAWSAERALS